VLRGICDAIIPWGMMSFLLAEDDIIGVEGVYEGVLGH